MSLQTNGSTIGLDSANLAIEFDPAVFEITGVSLGGVTRGFTLTDTYNNATGTLIVSEHSRTGAIPLSTSTQGALLLVDVTVRPEAELGASRINLLGVGRVGSSVLYTSLNDGYLTLTPAPNNSDLTPTDGVVTITATATRPGPLRDAGRPCRASPGHHGRIRSPPPSAQVACPDRGPVPLRPPPAIGSALVAAGPPAAVDLAIEATHGDTGPINRNTSPRRSGRPRSPARIRSRDRAHPLDALRPLARSPHDDRRRLINSDPEEGHGQPDHNLTGDPGSIGSPTLRQELRTTLIRPGDRPTNRSAGGLDGSSRMTEAQPLPSAAVESGKHHDPSPFTTLWGHGTSRDTTR